MIQKWAANKYDIQPIFFNIFSDGLDEESIEFTTASCRLITTAAISNFVWDVDSTVRDWLQQRSFQRSRNWVVNNQKSDTSEKITNWWELKILFVQHVENCFMVDYSPIDGTNTPLTLNQAIDWTHWIHENNLKEKLQFLMSRLWVSPHESKRSEIEMKKRNWNRDRNLNFWWTSLTRWLTLTNCSCYKRWEIMCCKTTNIHSLRCQMCAYEGSPHFIILTTNNERTIKNVSESSTTTLACL